MNAIENEESQLLGQQQVKKEHILLLGTFGWFEMVARVFIHNFILHVLDFKNDLSRSHA